MNKHPNAPAAAKPTKRRKKVDISLEEYDKIHELWEDGKTKKEISVIMCRSTGCITNSIVHLSREDVKLRIDKDSNAIEHYRMHETEDEDLSILSDKVLFQHSKEFIL